MTEKKGIDKFLELYPDEDMKELITNTILMEALEIPIEMIITEEQAVALSESVMKTILDA